GTGRLHPLPRNPRHGTRDLRARRQGGLSPQPRLGRGRGRRLHVAARFLPAGLLCRRAGPVPLPALQGRQPPDAPAAPAMSADRTIPIAPLTRAGFAPYGQMLSTEGAHHFPINGGTTERFHDLAAIRCEGPDARLLLSIFRGQPCTLPLALTLMERHPLGSQAFFPLDPRPFLVTVAHNENGRP